MTSQNPMCRAVFVYVALGAFALWGSNVRADELHVPGQYDTIQTAIDASSDGDVIVVAEGIYTGDGNRGIRFGGRAITVRSIDPENPAVVAATIIDTESSYGFFFYQGEPAEAVVDGLTITNTLDGRGSGVVCTFGTPTVRNCVITGHRSSGIHCYSVDAAPTIVNCVIADNAAEEAEGGGIFCGERSSPTILNCLITNNTAEHAGGGIYCESMARPVIMNCTITQNYVSPYYSRGGGICSHVARLTITDCVISDNITDGYESLGGGICCDGWGRAFISNCTITGNSAGAGGGVYLREVRRWRLTDCTITDNAAVYSDGGGVSCLDTDYYGRITGCTIVGNTSALSGGGIRCWYDNTEIEDCLVADNCAGESGGGVSINDREPDIRRCTIVGNSAAAFGGGIRCHDANALIEDCTVARNVAGEAGGGIATRYHGQPVIQNSTVAGNIAGVAGGNSYSGLFGEPIMLNSILWDGEAPSGSQIAVVAEEDVAVAATTVRYCDVQGGFEGAFVGEGCTLDWDDGNIDLPPLFLDADGADDDPNTWEDNDYHLADDSPCVDAGDPNYAPYAFETDIDGQARLWDGDDDGLDRIDMGSDEVGAWCFGDLDGDGVINTTDLLALLANYGTAEGMTYTDGDFDYDGGIDLADLAELLSRYNTSCM